MNLENIELNEISQIKKGPILHDSTYMKSLIGKFIGTESILELTRDWWDREMESYCLIVTEFVF